METIFVDTAGWLCLADRSQPEHAQARSVYQDRAGIRAVTTNYILAELFALLSSRTRLPRTQILDFIVAIRSSAQVEVVYADAALDSSALDLLRSRLDKHWSLADAVSFIVMQQHGITEALTTDHHFEQAGFQILLK